MTEGNPYLRQISETLPRLLASYDRDPLSPTLGLGDRGYWAWKTIDFANATPQGAVNGLAQLIAANLLPDTYGRSSVLQRIDEMIAAVSKIVGRDGALVEAYPNEKSFCVTALVAFDILCAADTLEDAGVSVDYAGWRETVAPLIEFIIQNDETHGVISNHLATAVAALYRWRGKGAAIAETRGRAFLDRILDHQSSEGWFCEYGAADPGYETLGLYYLSDAHRRRPDLGLRDPLSRSLSFLTHFAHPDGSFAGVYGARNTRFLVPGGLENLAGTMPVAAALADFARTSIVKQRVVTLSSMDAPNLAPHFNAYCLAAVCCEQERQRAGAGVAFEEAPFRRVFDEAGLFVDNGPDHYTIVGTSKGGVVAHFNKNTGESLTDGGAVGARGDAIYATQGLQKNEMVINGDTLTVTAPFSPVVSEAPTPMKFLVLRLLGLTVFRFRPFGELFKRILVRRLISSQRPLKVVNHRRIHLGPSLSIDDEMSPAGALTPMAPERIFKAIHMASSGYWQTQDDVA